MPSGRYEVRWEVAADENFRTIEQTGEVEALPELGYSVHPEVHGLRPGRDYFYRFKAGSEISPVGRTRTAPAPDDVASGIRLAMASCQRWEAGLFTAYQHMAREDLDLVVHLGDYIYEMPITDPGPRSTLPPRVARPEPMTLEQYRYRYAVYKSDQHLQATHAAFPFLVTWDDHEVENNYANEISDVDTEPDQDRAVFLQRRAQAYQAYYEHQPLRLRSMPHGPDMQVYRRISYGGLAELNVMDTRQYRSDQACGDGIVTGCDERLEPSRTLPGFEQERWLIDGLTRSRARWNVMAQQVAFSQRDTARGPDQLLNMDKWDGYAASRDRVRDAIIQGDVKGLVILTGDAHQNNAIDVKADFDDTSSAVIGSEFVGTSIASDGDGSDMTETGRAMLAENPHIKFFNSQRGYVLCTFTSSHCRADYRVVSEVTTGTAPIGTRASFVVDRDRPGLQSA
jgi:alkaline phosphatase D